MRDRVYIAVALFVALCGNAWAGVRLVDKVVPPVDAWAKASESAALFVGVREFPYDETLAEVPYAVDDAIDLAYVVSMECEPRLVDPSRVVLALSGDPQKAQTQKNLQTLIEAGAKVKAAGQSDILALLDEQARAVEGNGMLIVAFATHGVAIDGVQYLLTASSMLRYRETSLAETTVRDIVAQARVPRVLILIDACRRRLTSDTRTEGDPRTAAAMLNDLAQFEGMAVLFAAAAGQYSYDDPDRRNGVFTAAVIDALRCGAGTNERGYVTLDTLSSYVEDRVLSWIQRYRDPNARRATQTDYEGKVNRMPLSACAPAGSVYGLDTQTSEAEYRTDSAACRNGKCVKVFRSGFVQ